MSFTDWRIRMADVCGFCEVRGYDLDVFTGEPIPHPTRGGRHLFWSQPFSWPIRTDLDRPFDWELDAVSGEFNYGRRI